MNKARTENLDVCRAVRREMGRHSVDCGEVQVTASHGVIHLHGRVRAMRGHEEQLETGITGLLKALRQRAGIRDVIADWTVG
ncbi:MAG: hypothetical protein H7Z41_17225 [Cytophagales bacterium]|nr:hypothetical protein [Armatimonadota bacterium]